MPDSCNSLSSFTLFPPKFKNGSRDPDHAHLEVTCICHPEAMAYLVAYKFIRLYPQSFQRYEENSKRKTEKKVPNTGKVYKSGVKE